MNLNLKIWRQNSKEEKGKIVDYPIADVSEHMSFLEMLDVLNEELIAKGEEPIAFDLIAEREYVACVHCTSMVKLMVLIEELLHVNCTCENLRTEIPFLEPFRATALPVIKDLVVDRSAMDRIQQAGGFISVNTSGNTQDANAIPIPKENADLAFDAATALDVVPVYSYNSLCFMFSESFSIFSSSARSS